MMRFKSLLLLGILGVFAFTNVTAQEFEEGKHFLRVPAEMSENPIIEDLRKNEPQKVWVFEFFSYGCHWCYKIDPTINTWLSTMPAHVEFQRVPVEFHPDWAAFTKVYYTAKDLNALNAVHSAFFDATQNGHITNTSENTLKQFFQSKGIKGDDFSKTYSSFDVDRKQKWAKAIAKAYKINAVPVFIVQGPKEGFMVNVRMAGDEENLVKILNYLINEQCKSVAKHLQNQDKVMRSQNHNEIIQR